MKQRGETPDEDWANGWVTEGIVTKVEPNSDKSGWAVTNASGWTCGVPDHGIEPKIGDTLTTFGQLGYRFHGHAINGEVLWYLTRAEEEAERQEDILKMNKKKRSKFESDKARLDFESDKARLDKDYASLPTTFQERIDKFRNTNPDWRWEYESYEMSCCVDAIKIAEYCINPQVAEGETVADRIKSYLRLPWEEQKKAGIFDGHSGNSFGMAWRLAYQWVTDPGLVVLEHGALVPLVGCMSYGCPHDE